MFNDRKWFAFFSHTGSEIYKLIKKTGKKPYRIITTQPPGSKEIDKRLLKFNVEILYVSSKPTVQDYERMLNPCIDCVCTLHGWMRIIPGSVCKSYEMYNLHPGLITKYPELKGKDPQSRVDPEIHDKIGLVIHRVTAGVDEGPIVVESSCHNVYNGESQVTDRLKDMAIHAWLDAIELLSNYE